jgi:hypothetical protein
MRREIRGRSKQLTCRICSYGSGSERIKSDGTLTTVSHREKSSFHTVHVLQLFVDALSTIDMMHSTAKGYK